MQLVARIEKTDPPSRTQVCAATATAVVRLLSDERTLSGPWRDPVGRWLDGRIRKHARRARGVAFERVCALDGVTAEVAGAQVRALVPGPVDSIPPSVRKLQLTGHELDDPDKVVAGPPPGSGVVVVSITPDPALPLGKAAAAAGHAAQLAWMYMPKAAAVTWQEAGFPLVVEQPDLPGWRRRVAAADHVVADAGFTVVEPGTVTAVATWR